ncbi:MerR-like DNA binding protein [Mucilaginibacter frigoritolerans]|jgi:chaperone modulatory protein CbpM|uniref:MerR-like DNA binding protein n=1 Tax=Mucilaginibacter frigoritolerans TaxID=652788 RepID=A0A562UHD4_9SPHI|nr:chaperone modulator CbpM [Mucilaginibacter frigoritolerans]TWJ04481.1 MerR-like DNA binding protein [Mucilaginibacter frigoritolerans]
MTNLIATTEICTYHNVTYTFISSLNEAGLLELEEINHTTYITESELQKLEKMIRMHQELEINIAGIEAITHLLQKVEQMQEELRVLKNRLRN